MLQPSVKRDDAPAFAIVPSRLSKSWIRRPLSAAGFCFWSLALTLAVSVAACLLPHDPYIRYQSLNETIHNRAGYFYERVHFDPTAIDVLIIGGSREQRGSDVPALERRLAEQGLGKVHVLNMSLPQTGDDLHYALLKDALSVRRPKLVMIGILEQQARTGHPAFRDLAEVSDVAMAPMFLNQNYASNLLYMPMRQLRLAWTSLFGAAMGYQVHFDPARYLGPDIDTRPPPNTASRGAVETERNPTKEELDATGRAHLAGITRPLLPRQLAAYEFAVPRTYLTKMKELCDDLSVPMIFIYTPTYQGPIRPWDAAFYEPLAPILSPGFISQDDSAYQGDAIHLNEQGADRVTRWLAETLPPYLKTGH